MREALRCEWLNGRLEGIIQEGDDHERFCRRCSAAHGLGAYVVLLCLSRMRYQGASIRLLVRFSLGFVDCTRLLRKEPFDCSCSGYILDGGVLDLVGMAMACLGKRQASGPSFSFRICLTSLLL